MKLYAARVSFLASVREIRVDRGTGITPYRLVPFFTYVGVDKQLRPLMHSVVASWVLNVSRNFGEEFL